MSDPAEVGRSARIAGTCRTRLWPLAVALMVVAVVVVWRNETGLWVGDNRFEQYENPGRRLARMMSIWDTSRGLGRLRVDFWPGVTLPLGLMRVLGLSRAATEHLWHAALIATGGIGTAAFLRLRLPRIGLAHVTAALLYMFGPYSVGFLLPSNLYLNYAMAPWIFVLFVRGVHSRQPWRWAAMAALVVFAIGNTEVAGLAYAFVYLLPISLFLVHFDKTTTWRRVFGWATRFGILAIGVSAVTILVTLLGSEVFDQNLRETEAPTVLNGNSSWAESWRGLGFWLHYHVDSTGFARPQVITFLSDPLAIASSFIPPIAATAMIALGRGRDRVLFGAMMITGLTMMVGLYPLNDPSPYGELLRWTYDTFSSLQVLRNNYKAASGAMVAIACLAGIAASQVWEWTRGRLRRDAVAAHAVASLTAVLMILLLAGISQPFWRGQLYPTDKTLEAVPDYVNEASAWLDRQPGGGRVLVLPRAYRSEFRWGWVNDDVLDAYIDRPHVVEVPIHLSRPVPADAITAVDDNLVDRLYETGEIGPLARAFGVDLVMIRNDHVWESWDQPRPSAFDELRRDPDLVAVATFGRPGQNTVSDTDTSVLGERERELPPIEVYAVREPGRMVDISGPAPEILVSGDGAAMPMLASTGWLDVTPGLRFTGRLDAEELADAIEAGAPLIITDTNRRRIETITISAQESRTLAEGERLDRIPFRLFDAPGAETVSDYGDATSIRSSSGVAFGGGLVPWHRPAQAFDGDLGTTWLVGGLIDPRGETLQVTLAEPTLVSGIRLIAARPAVAGARRLTAATVSFSDGTVAAARLDDGSYRLDVAPRLIDQVTITVTGTTGNGTSPVGLAEVEIFGVDAEEWIETPHDVAAAAESNQRLDAALATARVGYAFERAIGEGPVDEERTIRRRFIALRSDTLAVSGRLRLQPGASDELLNTIAPTPVTAVATNRLLGGLQFRAGLMVDGSMESGWVADPGGENRIQLEFAPRPVETVQIITRAGQGLSTITEVAVETDDVRATGTAQPIPCDQPQCPVAIDVDLGGGLISSLSLTVTGIDRQGQNQQQPIRIDEIQLNAFPNPPGPDLTVASTRCIDGLVQLDGRSLAVRLRAPRATVLAGLPVPYESCDAVPVARGTHEFVAAGAAIVDTALLSPRLLVEDAVPTEARAEVLVEGPTSFRVAVDAPDGGVLSLGQSWHPSWRATLDGQDLGDPIEINTMAAWRLEPGSVGVVEVTFGLQRAFEIAVAISLGSVACCIWLATRREKVSR